LVTRVSGDTMKLKRDTTLSIKLMFRKKRKVICRSNMKSVFWLLLERQRNRGPSN